jgi:hypothetical protein
VIYFCGRNIEFDQKKNQFFVLINFSKKSSVQVTSLKRVYSVRSSSEISILHKTSTKGKKTEHKKVGKKDRKTERQKDRKTERQKDRKTERQKDRKTERKKDRKT